MLKSLRLALAFVLAIAAAGCRQADGPVPAPAGDQKNEIGDIARDLINVANKDPQATEELRSDLAKYGPTTEAVQQIDDLARDLSQSLAGARLDAAAAESLANTVWAGLNGKEMSERQIEALGRDLQRTLESTGVVEERAEAIAGRLGAVQNTMSENPRRWYQVF